MFPKTKDLKKTSTEPVELTDTELDAVTGGSPAVHTWPPTLASSGDFLWKSQGPYGQSTYHG
jgi:hypothetical protein